MKWIFFTVFIVVMPLITGCDTFRQKHPTPVSSFIIQKTCYDDMGTTKSQMTYYWQSQNGEVKAEDWSWPSRYRTDRQWWGDHPIHVTIWHEPNKYYAYDHISGKAFATIYPPEDQPCHHLNMVIVDPSGWKYLLKRMRIESNDNVQIDEKFMHRYSGQDTFDSSDKSLYIDPDTALLSSIRDNYYDDEGNLNRFEIYRYSWNKLIDTAVFEPRFPGDAKPLIVDLSQQSLIRQIHPGIGAGEIKLGMSRKSVSEILGQPDWVWNGDSPVELYFNYGMELNYNKNGRLLKISCNNAGVNGLVSESKKYSGKTPEGIGIGSTLKDVIKTYGDPDSKDDAVYSLYVYRQKNMSLRINTQTNCVDQIDIWQLHP